MSAVIYIMSWKNNSYFYIGQELEAGLGKTLMKAILRDMETVENLQPHCT